MKGCIGALDGWLVRIKSPSEKECRNPGKYFCRKGFYAINVQVIVDRKKRILWRCIGAKGSSHDSSVFNESSLAKTLLRLAVDLWEKGLYIVADSAYALRNYVLVPYDNAKTGSREDAFNFFQSSMRIYVECTFGEIDRRWGIFWRPLEGSLFSHKYTIDSALRLHNFIVDYREEMNINDINEQRKERAELDAATDEFRMKNPMAILGPLVDDFCFAEIRTLTRSGQEKASREKGVMLRDFYRDELWRSGSSRPAHSTGSATKDQNGRVVVE